MKDRFECYRGEVFFGSFKTEEDALNYAMGLVDPHHSEVVVIQRKVLHRLKAQTYYTLHGAFLPHPPRFKTEEEAIASAERLTNDWAPEITVIKHEVVYVATKGRDDQ